ncbi:MAG: histidyl-tRNA synthetase [Acidobacteriota bacterium]|jgi:histidyl-tRNA synthetase|nr:histidyl-tRNA synthetase [Acidobacteriota bacterium]
MPETVEPRLSRGLRDLLPEQMLPRQWMIDTVRGVYELYGFVPLSTPAIEYLDVLRGSSAGAEAQQSIFTVSNPEEEALGLRFDLTVPLARVVAQYRDLPRPFRRYQVSPVWRADKPGPGRFREFTQFDLDSVGTESEIADTEIIAGMCDSLAALKVGYKVRFSSRGILNLLLAYADLAPERGVDVFRVLDKLDKVGLDKIKLELTKGYYDASGDFIPGLGLATDQVEKIERFLGIRSDDRREVVAQLRDIFGSLPEADREIGTVEAISNHLYALGYGDEPVALDLSIARGLAYYTGPVFEAMLLDAPQFGSVFGGGRYDGLVLRFLGEKVPATGASMGVDRLLAALVHLGRAGQQKATAKVLVTNMDPALKEEYLAITFELRRAGIPAEMYLGLEKGIGKQIKYADGTGIPLVLLLGSTEKERGVVTLKDMEMGRRRAQKLDKRQEWLEERPGQREVPRAQLVSGVKDLLGQIEGGGK